MNDLVRSPTEPPRPQSGVTVISWLRESMEDTLRFVAWYLDLGVDHMHLYLDDPDDPCQTVLAQQPGISCWPCTSNFWAHAGLTPNSPHPDRQKAALSHGYANVTSGWVLTVDADELLYPQDGLPALLKTLPEATRSASILPVEAIRSDKAFTGLYRCPMENDDVRRVYGPVGQLMLPRRGLVGHIEGKSLTRAGLPISGMHQHYPLDAEGKPVSDLALDGRQGVWLLHLFDRGYELWRSRLERVGGRSFGGRLSRHIRKLREESTDPEAELRNLYRQLQGFDDRRLSRLRAAGGLLAPDLDLDAPARRMFEDFLS